MMKMKFFTRNIILSVSGVLAGGAGGFLYYYFIGCQTGSCAITSNPWLSILWGAAFGYLVFDFFKKKKQAQAKSDQTNN
jgi:xanthine/uracil permease